MTVTHRKRTANDAEKDIAEAGVKYHCDPCSRNITDTVRIRCAICSDFDLCVSCFCNGVELGKHKNWHDYRVMEQHSFPIFDTEWGADEELLLIEGAENFGIGNWQDIADHVGSKTRDECEAHYLQVYVNSDTWPLPDMSKRFDMDPEAQAARKRQRLAMRVNRVPAPVKAQKPMTSQPANHEIAGYMPGRLEFETEYENEAEQSVKDMLFSEEDAPEEVDLKLMVLEIYNAKLSKRLERRKFVFDRGFLEYKKNQAVEKKRSPKERELINSMRVFAQLQTPEDYDKFIEGLLKEMHLRERIAELQELRANGLTTLATGQEYLRDKSNRTSLRHLMTRDTGMNDRRNARPLPQRANLDETPSPRGAAAGNKATPVIRKPANPLNIQNAEGIHLLTVPEQALCSTLRIFPKSYMIIKEQLLKEHARLGGLKRRQARELIKIDVNKTGKIYDFFVEAGWIQNSDA
ncbi:Transcriptional adapter ada2 [Mortierella hygrophila]|uniref:Transcriptional adapter 2 n=1 Tax=Mortierella hygrophila TaxID=979708 RepID=A0A9P6FCC1_9FUNG|nr:Transcriptional adapter ada2 [Mortierella hygrophila]